MCAQCARIFIYYLVDALLERIELVSNLFEFISYEMYILKDDASVVIRLDVITS